MFSVSNIIYDNFRIPPSFFFPSIFHPPYISPSVTHYPILRNPRLIISYSLSNRISTIPLSIILSSSLHIPHTLLSSAGGGGHSIYLLLLPPLSVLHSVLSRVFEYSYSLNKNRFTKLLLRWLFLKAVL